MRRFLAVLAATAMVSFCWATPATAERQQPRVVSANPVDWTPHVLDGQVNAIAVVGDTVVVGGDFRRISEAGSRRWVQRPHLFSFDRQTGRLRDFWPSVDGPVNALAAGPDNTVYVGGSFREVNNTYHRGVVRLNLYDGEVSDGFEGAVDNGDVRSLHVDRGSLYITGSFSSVGRMRQAAVARLDAYSGIVDQQFRIDVSAPNRSRVKVEDSTLSPDGRHLVIIGELTHVNNQLRPQLAVINVGGRYPTLNDWSTNVYDIPCHKAFGTYVRAVDFSPGGDYFVVVTTGASAAPRRMCDTAARFDLRGRGVHQPTWVNHTGGDTLSSVAVTGAAVYVGGHQRWMSNPYGRNFPGRGAIARTGIAALDPRNGEPLAWDPTRTRGKGVQAMVATEDGLYIGSDTDRLGGEYHGKLGMFPLS